MKSFGEATALISSLAKPFPQEYISLEDTDGRILAENIFADRNYPPFNRAAMDGFALMYSDWQQGIRNYKIAEVIYAGRSAGKSLTSGYCYKIMTGAATPASANVIIRREDAVEQPAEVTLTGDALRLFQNIAKEGEDAKAGDQLLEAPLRCDPQVISLLTTIGKTSVDVYKLPKVALITTGNEVVQPSETITPFQIRNSNQYLLKSLLKKWNIVPEICRHVPDDKAMLKQALKEAIQSEITIINGGVSAGDADFVPRVLKELGVNEVFHKAAIRPGKPIWIGQAPNGGIVFALPGNPLSCLTTFIVFVELYLYQCFGFKERPVYRLPILQNRNKKHLLTEFFPASIDKQHFGINALPFNGSGDITASIKATGLAIQHVEQLKSGDFVDFYPFNNFL